MIQRERSISFRTTNGLFMLTSWDTKDGMTAVFRTSEILQKSNTDIWVSIDELSSICDMIYEFITDMKLEAKRNANLRDNNES